MPKTAFFKSLSNISVKKLPVFACLRNFFSLRIWIIVLYISVLQRNLRKGFQTRAARKDRHARNSSDGNLFSGEEWESHRWCHHRETKRGSESDACQWKKWRRRQRRHEQGLYNLTVVNNDQSMLGLHDHSLTFEIANWIVYINFRWPKDMSNINPITMSLFRNYFLYFRHGRS